jgi:calcineurin-like phosphoesterase family protein
VIPTHVISDTHFGHANILLPAYDGQFRTAWGVSTVEEMDQYLIAQWNAVIGPDDVVLHLGDLCFGERGEAARLRAHLHGRIILVIGNHDRSGTVLREAGFDLVTKRYEVEIPTVGRIVARHDPSKFTAEDAAMAAWLVHGHCHARRVSLRVEEPLRSKCRCASVERLPHGAPMRLEAFLRHPLAGPDGLLMGSSLAS